MRLIFLLCSGGLIFSSCDSPVRPIQNQLEGKWQISWNYQGEELYGDIVFKGEFAYVSVFGHEGSVFLEDFQEATFRIALSDQVLTLTNIESDIRLNYMIANREADHWLLTYLNDVEVHLQRNSD